MAAKRTYWRRWPLVTDRQRGQGALYAAISTRSYPLSFPEGRKSCTCSLRCGFRSPARCQKAENCDKEPVHDAPRSLNCALAASV